uniref:Neuromedin U C-terminal domain-containing protein n=1 Tax=Neogobius melanostomus TaxID=47308 RepID=A0A8C6UK65_9GOBI
MFWKSNCGPSCCEARVLTTVPILCTDNNILILQLILGPVPHIPPYLISHSLCADLQGPGGIQSRGYFLYRPRNGRRSSEYD